MTTEQINIAIVRQCDDNDVILSIDGREVFYQVYDDGSNFMLSDPTDPGTALPWLADAENRDEIYEEVGKFMSFKAS